VLSPVLLLVHSMMRAVQSRLGVGHTQRIGSILVSILLGLQLAIERNERASFVRRRPFDGMAQKDDPRVALATRNKRGSLGFRYSLREASPWSAVVTKGHEDGAGLAARQAFQ
jgi:hypothetical protein